MSAVTLRRAAALMRERAEGASAWKPGPWFAVRGVIYGGTAAPHQVIAPITTYDGDAAHIASWHPAVALAVADWLDEEARWSARGARATVPEALTVARAYLGENAP